MEKREVFGTFVANKRKAVGLSQQDLADRLHVTVSAVSKWERGVSYPDITMIQPLSAALNVTDHELMMASDDRDQADVTEQAHRFRVQRNVVQWGSGIAYSIALLTCFIVNLSVNRGLTWFFIVLTALMVAASLTILPYRKSKRRWLVVLGAFLVSLWLLFLAVWAYTGGGLWIVVAVVATLFGMCVVFGPLVLRSLDPLGWIGRNKMVMCMAVDTVLLFPLVAVSMVAGDVGGKYDTVGLPLIGICLVPVWLIALVIRYLPVSGWFRAAITLAIIGVWEFAINPLISAIAGGMHDPIWGPFNLMAWGTSDLINANVRLLTSLGCLLAAAVCTAVGVGRARSL